jgi:hypothetical protein
MFPKILHNSWHFATPGNLEFAQHLNAPGKCKINLIGKFNGHSLGAHWVLTGHSLGAH